MCWALFLLLHPTGEGEDFYPIVSDQVTAWMTVHLATLVFVPLMAGVVLLLLRGVGGAAATVSRAALGVFMVVYMAWEVLIGIGTGVLVDQVNQLEGADQAAGAGLVEAFTDSGLVTVIETVGTGAWVVALCAAGIALVRRAGGSCGRADPARALSRSNCLACCSLRPSGTCAFHRGGDHRDTRYCIQSLDLSGVLLSRSAYA